MERDVPNAEYHDFAKIQEGGICPKCGKKTVKISQRYRGRKYLPAWNQILKSMNMTYVDANGESKTRSWMLRYRCRAVWQHRLRGTSR